MMQSQILIADDHHIIRFGFKQLIESESDLHVAAEASTSSEALHLLASSDFHLLLLDISLPDRSGVETLGLIRQRVGSIPILMISAYPEEQYAINLLRAGANGYLRKDADNNEIIRAIRTILNGRKYISDIVAELLTQSHDSLKNQPLHHDLSPREFQVLIRLAVGQSATSIANELFISVKSVSTYRARLLEKLQLKTNADITYYAIKNELIQ